MYVIPHPEKAGGTSLSRQLADLGLRVAILNPSTRGFHDISRVGFSERQEPKIRIALAVLRKLNLFESAKRLRWSFEKKLSQDSLKEYDVLTGHFNLCWLRNKYPDIADTCAVVVNLRHPLARAISHYNHLSIKKERMTGFLDGEDLLRPVFTREMTIGAFLTCGDNAEYYQRTVLKDIDIDATYFTVLEQDGIRNGCRHICGVEPERIKHMNQGTTPAGAYIPGLSVRDREVFESLNAEDLAFYFEVMKPQE